MTQQPLIDAPQPAPDFSTMTRDEMQAGCDRLEAEGLMTRAVELRRGWNFENQNWKAT